MFPVRFVPTCDLAVELLNKLGKVYALVSRDEYLLLGRR